MAKQRPTNKNGKFRSQKPQNPKSSRNIKSRTIVKKRISSGRVQGSRVQDARQKIIQKKQKVTDAREILSKKSKIQDARSKINRIRDRRSHSPPARRTNIKVIGSSILRKTDPNGKISLITNKSSHKSDINLAIQKQLGLIPNGRGNARRTPPKRSLNINSVKPVSIRKTILNDVDYYEPEPEPLRIYEPALYKWTKPDLRAHPASRMINALDTRQAVREAIREELHEWPTYASHVAKYRPFRLQSAPVAPSGYIDLDNMDDEEMPLVSQRSNVALQGTSRISNIRSRLDNVPQQESHGIFSQPKAKVMVPAGHRIVVSNLQPTVTQDDIKELFEDIGQLLAAKLVRPGVAEVIYKNLKDAQKAVDTYHNRQLDGQPMKCLLVNKRPLNHPTAPAIKTEATTPSRAVAAIPPCAPNNKLTPDISTIHKVLFQRK